MMGYFADCDRRTRMARDMMDRYTRALCARADELRAHELARDWAAAMALMDEVKATAQEEAVAWENGTPSPEREAHDRWWRDWRAADEAFAAANTAVVARHPGARYETEAEWCAADPEYAEAVARHRAAMRRR